MPTQPSAQTDFFQPKHQFVSVIGNVGSGKSTALPILSENLAAEAVEADTFFQTTNPFAKDYLENMDRWAFTNELWMTFERFKMLSNLRDPEKLKIVDSGLLMSWVYTYSHFLTGRITEDEWNLYRDIFEQLSQHVFNSHAAVVRLKYSVPTLLERIQRRGRDYELKYYTADYLTQLEEGIEALTGELQKKEVFIVEIDEHQVADFEHNPVDTQQLITLVSSALA